MIVPDSTYVSEFYQSPNFDDRVGVSVPRMIVLHHTDLVPLQAVVSHFLSSESKVSSHYIIDEDGCVVQMVQEAQRAWHAGLSFWDGISDVNSFSIGIEIVNRGYRGGSASDFLPKQMESLCMLCLDLIHRYDIPPMYVVAHSDIAPSRKVDPSGNLDWKWLASRGVGLWVEPACIPEGSVIMPGMRGDFVAEVQRQFAVVGYGIDVTGYFCRQSQLVTAAFQRHFRPRRITGWVDYETRTILTALESAARCTKGAGHHSSRC